MKRIPLDSDTKTTTSWGSSIEIDGEAGELRRTLDWMGENMLDAEVTAGAAPAPISITPDFPVSWDNSGDEQLFWTRDEVHFVHQMPPLEFSILAEAQWPAFYSAAEAYELLEVGPRVRLINTYYYSTMLPVVASPGELAARARRSETKLMTVLPQLRPLWNEKWLPEINQHMAYLESFDLPGSTLAELREQLEQAIKRFERLSQIHFQCFLPAGIALGLFEEFYCDLFGANGTFEAFRLVQGFDNKSLETGRALWHLSREARADPTLRGAFEIENTADILPALETTATGRAFLTQFNVFLGEYGKRSDKEGFSKPFWIEKPTPVINNLKSYLAQPDRDMMCELAAAAAEREELLQETRQRLSAYPRPVIEKFEMLLAAAQTATVLVEDHSFWLDYRVSYHVRQVLLEIGRRLTLAGALKSAEDIFYLTIDELRETARLPLQLVRKSLVAERQAEYKRFRDVVPPAHLGVPPSGPPPDSLSGRIMLSKVIGMPPTAGTSAGTSAGLLRGNPGSPGRAYGPAKVVRRLSEAAKLTAGDILVSPSTMPPWTPLFATAAAVVTDSGGILSHCAIVAREYRIPAVVGTGNATLAIRDGQIIEVDGEAGEVRIIDVE